MQAAEIPDKFPVAFASSAESGDIRPIPETTADPTAASLVGGFPPDTFTAIGAGGSPPDGRDFNGLLLQITQWNQWQQAGAPVGYDSTFSTSIGGYPKGAVLSSATFGQFWLSTIDDNATDPDSGGAGWARLTMASPSLNATTLRGAGSSGGKTAGWTIDQLTAATALNGIPYFGSGLSLNFNGAATGANGMDTGALPTAADFAIYAIYNPTTGDWATLGTTACNGPIYTGSNIPAGYAASALIFAGVTAGGNVQAFYQIGRQIFLINQTVLAGGGSPTFASVSLVTCVPVAAKMVDGNLACSLPNATLDVAAATSGLGLRQFSTNGGTNSASAGFSFVPMITPQTIYYKIDTGVAGISIESYVI